MASKSTKGEILAKFFDDGEYTALFADGAVSAASGYAAGQQAYAVFQNGEAVSVKDVEKNIKVLELAAQTGCPVVTFYDSVGAKLAEGLDVLNADVYKRQGVGWAKPVSTDPRNFKNPKQGMALTALAGPAANLILAYLAMVVWKLLYYWAPVNDATIFLALFLQYFVYLDVSLAVFNLIPVPPLDGSRVLLAVLPERIYFGMMKYERVILIVLLAAVWGGFLDGPLSVMNNVVWDLSLIHICAVQELATKGLNATCFTVINDGSEAAGCVVSASEDAGSMVEVGTTIVLYIAGDVPADAPAGSEAPSDTGTPAGGDAAQGGVEYDTD